jgi:hypothetical protein
MVARSSVSAPGALSALVDSNMIRLPFEVTRAPEWGAAESIGRTAVAWNRRDGRDEPTACDSQDHGRRPGGLPERLVDRGRAASMSIRAPMPARAHGENGGNSAAISGPPPNRREPMKPECNPQILIPIARRKTGLVTAALVVAGAAFWLTMPVSRPLTEAAPAFSIDSVSRETPQNLPTLSADTF